MVCTKLFYRATVNACAYRLLVACTQNYVGLVLVAYAEIFKKRTLYCYIIIDTTTSTVEEPESRDNDLKEN